MLDPEDLSCWLRLTETPGLGRGVLRRLLAAFGSPQGVFDAAPSARRDVAGTTAVAALLADPPLWPERLAALQSWLAQGAGRQAFALGEPEYPERLLQTADPPLLLFVQGRIELLHAPSVAVVGSRHPTAQGKDNARAFSAYLSQQGYTVVSGLALGVDGAAHEGALQAAGSTIAVVGTGLHEHYPRRHQALGERIAQQGLLLSEYAPGTPPLKQNFPLRNRLIAGLSLGTLVVEATLQSGSLITARLAAEAGREVFAIPGSIHSPQSHGCHALLRQGAKLVERGEDILEELRGLLAPAAAGAATSPRVDPQPTTKADPLLAALGHDPCTLDTLGARTGMGMGELGARLLELELGGQVARLPGGWYQRRAPA